MSDDLELDFELTIPADRGAEARRLGTVPEGVFAVAVHARGALLELYASIPEPPPTETAIENAIAADLVLLGVRIGRGEVPDVLLDAEADR